jgi:hypothetical protein
MEININSDRYQQFMNFLDVKFPTAEQNHALRQRLNAIGVCEKNATSPSTNDLTNRQVDVLEGIITADKHSITKIELYFRLFALYNEDAHAITMPLEYDADLKKLESLQIIISQGNQITLATPAPTVQKHAAEKVEEKVEEKAEASSAASSYSLRAKRKIQSPTTASSYNSKKSCKSTPHAHEIELLTALVKQLQENNAVLQSNQDTLNAMLTQQQVAFAAQQTCYNDLQTRVNQLEETHRNQNSTPVSSGVFYGNRPSPLFFNRSLNPTLSPLPLSPSRPLLADELEALSPIHLNGFAP